MNSINNSTVRLLAYITLVGGLLFISAALVTWMWDTILLSYFNLPEINILEACGLVSFALVLLFAVKFANNQPDKLSPEVLSKVHTCVKLTDHAKCQRVVDRDSIRHAQSMTNDQKKQLKDAIAKYFNLDKDQINLNPNQAKNN